MLLCWTVRGNKTTNQLHYRDISLVSYSGRGGGGNKGTVSYLLEDSWPRLYIVLGWTVQGEELQVLLSISDKHLQYEELLKRELNSLVMKVITVIIITDYHVTMLQHRLCANYSDD